MSFTQFSITALLLLAVAVALSCWCLLPFEAEIELSGYWPATEDEPMYVAELTNAGSTTLYIRGQEGSIFDFEVTDIWVDGVEDACEYGYQDRHWMKVMPGDIVYAEFMKPEGGHSTFLSTRFYDWRGRSSEIRLTLSSCDPYNQPSSESDALDRTIENQ